VKPGSAMNNILHFFAIACTAGIPNTSAALRAGERRLFVTWNNELMRNQKVI
jgi:cell division inhibitor SulA